MTNRYPERGEVNEVEEFRGMLEVDLDQELTGMDELQTEAKLYGMCYDWIYDNNDLNYTGGSVCVP